MAIWLGMLDTMPRNGRQCWSRNSSITGMTGRAYSRCGFIMQLCAVVQLEGLLFGARLTSMPILIFTSGLVIW